MALWWGVEPGELYCTYKNTLWSSTWFLVCGGGFWPLKPANGYLVLEENGAGNN
jgi:hypothetical protein